MEKSFLKKIRLATLLSFLLLAQIILPYEASASANLNYDNPNQGVNSAFKTTVGNVLNSGLLMAVVGCTGVVNKLSKSVTDLVGKAKDKALDSTDSINTVPTSSDSIQRRQDAANTQLQEDAKREECFNGIAYTLAKMQLTSMTKATMNWVNTGLNGNPLYVQDQGSFINRLGDAIIQREANWFAYDTTAYPYGRTYSTGLLNSQKFGQNFQQSMQSSLLNYVADGGTTQSYATNFSQGGWNAWLGLTQIPQNNPLGFNIKASQKLADDKAQEAAAKVDEINRNSGYLDQRKCKATQAQQNTATNAPQELADAQANFNIASKAYNDAFDAYSNDLNNSDKHQAANDARKALDKAQAALNTAQTNYNKNYSVNQNGTAEANCTEWETVTPGSTIKDKISTYINSPERQLELANTINQSLNALFTALIAKFQDQGLTSLGTTSVKFTNSTTSNTSTPANNTTNTSTGFTGSFDITKDLAGIIQTQKDYITVAKEGLDLDLSSSNVPKTVGELDYCIPGPNPDWETNSQPVKDAYFDWLNNISSTFVQKNSPKWQAIAGTILDPAGIFGPKSRDESFFILKLPDSSAYSSLVGPGVWNSGVWNGTSGPQYFYLGADGEPIDQEHIDSFVKEWTDYSNQAWANYRGEIIKKYGVDSPMQTEFIDPAGNGNLIKNTGFLEMAQAGLAITKNLKAYGDDNIAQIEEYKNSIATANANKYKLQNIKDQVDPIVKSAQCRRAEIRKNAGLPEIPIGLNCNQCIRSVDTTTSPSEVNFNCSGVNYTKTKDICL